MTSFFPFFSPWWSPYHIFAKILFFPPTALWNQPVFRYVWPGRWCVALWSLPPVFSPVQYRVNHPTSLFLNTQTFPDSGSFNYYSFYIKYVCFGCLMPSLSDSPSASASSSFSERLYLKFQWEENKTNEQKTPSIFMPGHYMHLNVQIYFSVLTLIFSLYFDFSEVNDLVIFPNFCID